MSKKTACCAVCVIYNPELHLLQRVINATASQVDKIFLIDNGSSRDLMNHLRYHQSVETVSLGKNLGIAAGLNRGIHLAREFGYQYVLLLDQDSIPCDGMIERYLEVMGVFSKANRRVAAVGPRYCNSAMGNTSRFVRFNWFHNSYWGSDDGPRLVKTDFLISSGSFFEIQIFETVGMFNEGFFIDHVDTEWCNRVRSLGFRFYGVWDVVMDHSLGESGLRLWFFRWRVQPKHKPFRLYYVMRNSILMYRMPNVSLKWMSGDVMRLLRLSIVYLIFFPPRGESFKWLKKGLVDGMKGVTGHGGILTGQE